MSTNVQTELPSAAHQCRLLSGKQVQEMFGISKRKLWELTFSKSTNRLPSLKLGKSRKYRLDKVIWWLEKQES